MTRIVYVVDDEEAIRRSLHLMLTLQKFSVTLFDSGTALLDAVDGLPPGCLLLDVRMPQIDGLDVQRSLAGRGVSFPTVVMTGHGDVTTAIEALRNGALSFIEKPFSKAALAEALDAAFEKLEDPAKYESRVQEAADRVNALSEGDRAVLAHLAAGMTNEIIARRLRVDAAAVELGRSRIFQTLAVGSLNDALSIAFAAGVGGAP